MSYTMEEAIVYLEQIAKTLQGISARNERLAQELEETEENEIQLIIQRDKLVSACERAINTIGMMNGGLVRDGAAYVTMVQGTLVQLIAAITAVEGENDQTVQR